MTEYEYKDVPRSVISSILTPEVKEELEALREAVIKVRAQVEECIRNNALLPFYLDALSEGKGKAKLVLMDDLSLMAHVEIDKAKKKAPGKASDKPRTIRPASSKLPSLVELRQRAAALNVDISDLGRRKADILQRLHEQSEWEKSGREALVVANTAPEPPVAPHAGLMDWWEDDVEQSTDDEPLPVRKPVSGFKKRGPAVPVSTWVGPRGTNLDDVVNRSKNIDLDKILSTVPTEE